MDKNENKSSILCNFIKHSPSDKESFISSYYCLTCSRNLCSECVIIHNSNPNYFNHKIENINPYYHKLKEKLEEINKNKNIININEEEGRNIANNKLTTFRNKLNELNNIFRNILKKKKKNYNEIENLKNNFENRNKIDNMEEKYKNLNDNYNELIKRQEIINNLYYIVENLVKNQNIEKSPDNKFRNLSICSNVNNYNIYNENCMKIDIIKCKESNISNMNNNNENKNIINKEQGKDSYNNNLIKPLFQTEKEKDKEEPKQIFKKIDKKDDNKIINNLLKEDIDSQSFPLNLPSQRNEKNFMNKKFRREIKKKHCNFCDDCEGHSYNNNITNYFRKKKIKSDEFTTNSNINNNTNINTNNTNINNSINEQQNELKNNKEEENNKVIFQQINNFKTSVKNIYINNEKNNEKKYNTYFNLFNLRLNKEGEVSLILFEHTQNIKTSKCFKSDQIKHELSFLHSDKFPFLCSRLINIENKAFIIGGKSYWDMNDIGNCSVFKLNFVNLDKKNNEGGEICCKPLKDTIYRHQSHHLIYSELYNLIFVLSGKNQKKCEYGILNKEKESIEEWKEFAPLRHPRENGLCFLFNEKYIYLLGGLNENNINKNSYDVFDISSIYADSKPQIWKTYNLEINDSIKSIFITKIPGIIENDNKIYVLGGYGYGIGDDNYNWKIEFSEDNTTIRKISLLKSKTIKNCEGIFSFYGQQNFVKFFDEFININIQGKCMMFNINQIDENIV